MCSAYASELTDRANPAVHQDYPGLDLIRFGAALLVAGYHIFFWWWVFLAKDGSAQVSALQQAGSLLYFPFKWGYVGVPVFFVLSGFVIAFTAENRAASTFIQSRALRLYPGAWVCATATLLISRIQDPQAIADWLRSVTLLPVGPWISGVYWTLAVEIAFYSLIAVALKSRVPLRSVATGLSLWGIGYWSIIAGYRVFGEPLHPLASMITGSPATILMLLPHGCLFALGMLMWSLSRPGAPRLHLLLLAPVLMACILSLWPAGAATIDTIMPAALWSASMGLMAAAIAFNGRISAILQPWRVQIRTLGLLTYPLYLIHEDVGRDAAMLLSRFVPPLMALVLAFAAVLALAAALLAAEQSIRGFLKSMLSARSRSIRSA